MTQIVLRAVVVLLVALAIGDAAAASSDELEKAYAGKVRPLLTKYCFGCHGAEKSKGGINIADYQSLAAVRRNAKFWKNVVHQLAEGEMPPEDENQPSKAERAALIGWLEINATRIDLGL